MRRLWSPRMVVSVLAGHPRAARAWAGAAMILGGPFLPRYGFRTWPW